MSVSAFSSVEQFWKKLQTLKLSSYVWEITNHAYTIWLVSTQSRLLHTDWSILENNEKATLHLNTPYSYMGDIREFTFVNFCKLPGDIILGLFYVQTVNQHQIETKNRSTSVDNCTFSWFFTSSVVLTTSSSEISFFFVCSLSSYFDYKEIQRQRIKITLWKYMYTQNLAAWL